MSFLITYKCSNKNCKLYVHLSEAVPVWMDEISDDPKYSKERGQRKYKYGWFKKEEACIKCKTISMIEYGSNYHTVPQCPKCSAIDSFVTLGKICHLCNQGEIVESESERAHFYLGGSPEIDEDYIKHQERIMKAKKPKGFFERIFRR